MSAMPKIDFVIFYVSDLEESRIYFTEKLGFTYVAEESGPQFAQLKGGEGGPGFGLVEVNAETPKAGNVRIYFKTDNLAGLRATLVNRGVAATTIEQRPFGSIFDVPTPDDQFITMLS
jgi:catechol 2,3-dioxygenase-like lactoylglutathione lyase family enzyme